MPTLRARAKAAILFKTAQAVLQWVGAQLGGRQCDHAAETRTVRSTVASRASSVRGAMCSTPPPSILIKDGRLAGAAIPSGARANGSAVTGTKLGYAVVVALTRAQRACRHQSKTCCGLTCQQRATSVALAPGSTVSATMRASSSFGQLCHHS